MHSFFKKGFEISNSFTFNTIVSVDELSDHDMIYIYHHLQVGSVVNLTAAGTNVKGDLRYKVAFKNFILGFVTLGEAVRTIYENCQSIDSEIVGLKKQKFLPINGIDISLKATKMKMVS